MHTKIKPENRLQGKMTFSHEHVSIILSYQISLLLLREIIMDQKFKKHQMNIQTFSETFLTLKYFTWEFHVGGLAFQTAN